MTQVTQTLLTGARTMALAAIAATAATPRPSGDTQNAHALRIVHGIGTRPTNSRTEAEPAALPGTRHHGGHHDDHAGRPGRRAARPPARGRPGHLAGRP
ncbi:hypothetical protein AB0I68_30200 [Streptomyces sp. NPDC050448]|uniref:hypothetical protein n=1 Tax=Streptomyces sp. NPDC050448 TaxID=3155404 RepID=UPI00342F1A21